MVRFQLTDSPGSCDRATTREARAFFGILDTRYLTAYHQKIHGCRLIILLGWLRRTGKATGRTLRVERSNPAFPKA